MIYNFDISVFVWTRESFRFPHWEVNISDAADWLRPAHRFDRGQYIKIWPDLELIKFLKYELRVAILDKVPSSELVVWDRSRTRYHIAKDIGHDFQHSFWRLIALLVEHFVDTDINQSDT